MGGLYILIFYSAKLWAQDSGLKMTWWKWTLTGLWFTGLSLTVAEGFTLIGENEVEAGLRFLAFFMIVNFIPGVILWRIISTGREKQDTAK